MRSRIVVTMAVIHSFVAASFAAEFLKNPALPLVWTGSVTAGHETAGVPECAPG